MLEEEEGRAKEMRYGRLNAQLNTYFRKIVFDLGREVAVDRIGL